MDVYRKWYCTCSGKPLELSYDHSEDEEDVGEPACERCGATPSSDPKRTISYKDVEEWDV
jgi:hypothetical protein